MLSDRAKVGLLRGLLYAIKFAIDEKDVQGLEQGLRDDILKALDLTQDEENYELRGAYRPGYAFTGLDYKLIVPDAPWTYTSQGESFAVKVVSRDPSGQVHLRPCANLNLQLDAWYPPGAFGKDNPDPCPFLRVDAKMAQRGAKDGLREGDLLCHEAWGVWVDLTPGSV